MGQAARSTASVCTVVSALPIVAFAGAHPATRDLTALTCVHQTLTGSTALPVVPVKMPLPAPPLMAHASARKVGSVETAQCLVLLAPGASVAMPVASVPMRESAAPKLEPVPVPLGGMELTASFPVQQDSSVKAVPVSVTVTTLMAVTLFMDAADVRLAGWACGATCLAQRGFGEPTAATLVPAKTGVLVYLRMATVCAHQDSEAPPARGPARLVAMANAVCSASATIILPATRQMGLAIVWQAGQALTALNHVPQATGDSNAPNCVSVIMVEPATPRMGAAPVLQAGLDPTAWKAAHLECLVSTAPSYASVVLERSATQRLGPVPVPGDTVVHPAEWEAKSPSPSCPPLL